MFILSDDLYFFYFEKILNGLIVDYVQSVCFLIRYLLIKWKYMYSELNLNQNLIYICIQYVCDIVMFFDDIK